MSISFQQKPREIIDLKPKLVFCRFKATFGKPVLTPVRRSVRLEHASAQHPSVVQEHGLTVRTLEELPEEIQQDVLFKPNFAVRAELNEAWNQLRLDYNQ